LQFGMLQGQTGIPKETMRRNSLALGTVSTDRMRG
jgi:hypothetical protein